jgi:hypothetical protein
VKRQKPRSERSGVFLWVISACAFQRLFANIQIMKSFNYTARDKTGALKRGSLQAVDRSQALHQLATQGVVPLSVAEGSPLATGRQLQSSQVIAVVVFCLVIVFAVTFFILDKPKEKHGTSKNVKAAKVEVRDRKLAKNSLPNENVATASNSVARVSPVDGVTEKKSFEKEPKTDDGLMSTNNVVVKPKPIFSTTTEQVISWIANTVPGNTPPPLIKLPVTERTNIVSILNSDIVLYDEDSDKVVEIKYNVAYAKQMLKDYLAKGGKTEDFLAYYHKELWSSHNEWRESQKKVIELQKAGDGEGAVKYFMEQNKVLQAKGIKPVMLPPALNHLIKLEEEPGQQ